MGLDRLCDRVTKAHTVMDQMVFDLDSWMGRDRDTKRVSMPRIVRTCSAMCFTSWRSLLKLADNSEDASQRQDMMAAGNRLESLSGDARAWIEQSDSDCVYWLNAVWSSR